MALAFKAARIPITNEAGAHEDTQTQTFPREIKVVDNRPVAQVAIQSFKLDLAGGARPTDIVQVTASVADAGGATVTVRVKTDYSGGRYSGEVSVLIIADLKD
jgi:hypothetical protein